MFVRNRLFAAFSIAFLSGCAAVNAPEGGPRDEKQPLLVTTTPANASTNFTGKTITLEFDEDVKPQDLNKELIVTPNTGNTYNATSDRKKIILEFSKPLEENTTYFLSFRDGIVDITEGNKAPEVTLSFSTGEKLDTASVMGKVIDYITAAPEANITVAMYPEKDTGNIKTQKPYYFTRTNTDGSFKLQNIKNGNYRIFAHNDKNTNEVYDQETEKIGYLLNQISVNPIADSVIIKTVRLDSKKPFLVTTEKALDQNVLVFSEGIQALTFQPIGKNPAEKKLLFTTDPTGKRTTVYPENGKLPEAILAISVDSSGNQGQDTIKFALANKPQIPKKLTYKLDKTELQTDEANQIKITFPVPIIITGKQPFSILEDTTTKINPSYPQDYQLNSNQTELILTYTAKAKKTAELLPDTTQFTAINGKPFQKQSQKFNITRKASTGSISGTVKTNSKNYAVELLNEGQQLLKTERNIKRLQYQDLQPGNYTIRVKVDENNDGNWSLGNKQFTAFPEKLYIYPKPINVRANWEIEDIDLVF